MNTKILRYNDKKTRFSFFYNWNPYFWRLYFIILFTVFNSELSNIVEKFTFENLPEEEKGLGTQRQFAKLSIWKEKFSHDEIEILKEIMGSNLGQLGYD